MEYVMVPVPEELVDEVRDFMRWQVRAPKVVDNPEALEQVFAEADPQVRALLRFIAEVTVEEALPGLREAADAAGMSIRETVGSFNEIHGRLREAGRETFLLMTRPDPREMPEGTLEFEHKVIHMNRVDAAVIAGH